MPDVYTPELNLVKPEVGGSLDTWGEKLNSNMDILDTWVAESESARSAAEAKAAQLTGMIAAFLSQSAPAGWLELNGQVISRTTYAGLWAFAQASGLLDAAEATKERLHFGPGDGSTTFSLPNVQGVFFRALDRNYGLDPDRAAGSYQAPQNLAHNHGGITTSGGIHSHTASIGDGGYHGHGGVTDSQGYHRHAVTGANITEGDYGDYFDMSSAEDRVRTEYTEYDGAHTHNVTVHGGGVHSHTVTVYNSAEHAHTLASDGGSEARPSNVAVLYCIRY